MTFSLPRYPKYPFCTLIVTAQKAALLFILVLLSFGNFLSAQCAFKPIGHRGGSSYYYPENTLVSLEQGFLEDIFAAEVDIRYTSDSVLVLMHDSYIDRTTNGIGEVR
jgi:glycerophosphoryl diester phosphodiesterase